MSIVSTILGVESGGRNVTQGNIGDINNRTGDLAQGYFQITGATWRDFGGLSTGFSSAIQAPYSTQLQIAENIPVSRWGPATQSALQSAGYSPQPGETLGQMLNRYGEDGSATTPADGGAGGAFPGAGNVSGGPADGSSGLQAGSGAGGGNIYNPPSSGQPTTVVGLSSTTTQAAQDWASQFETGVGNAFTKAFTGATQTAQGWFGSAENFMIRIGIILAAIVLIGVGLATLAPSYVPGPLKGLKAA